MNKQQLIRHLQLEPHLEGGYFRRTYSAALSGISPDGRERPFMSSIFYLLTDDSPVGYFHRNRSDIVHYWHCGSSLTYFLVDPRGHFQQIVLGPDMDRGQQLQLTVPGGVWKATRLNGGEFGLLSEAVTPGFEYADMELATADTLQQAAPHCWDQHNTVFRDLCKPG